MALVAQLLPATPDEAAALARRLPVLDEHAAEAGPRAAGLARLVTRHGMQRFGLTLSTDGRVVREGRHHVPLRPTAAFAQGEVTVVYTAAVYPGRDHFQFTGPAVAGSDVPAPIPFSGSAWWSHLAPADAVAALGGPAAYAARYAAAKGAGQAAAFEAALDGPAAVPQRRPRCPAALTPPVSTTDEPPPAPPAGSGTHTTRVAGERAAGSQRTLF